MSLSSIRSFSRRMMLGMTLAGSAALLAGCGSTDSTAPDIPSNPGVETYAAATGVVIAQMTKVSDNLYTRELVAGTGAQAVSGDNIVVTYRGMLSNGQIFDQGSIPFQLGVGQVIPGWDQGVAGMRVGGKRQLVIGSTLAYRNSPPRGSGIPANATLVFDVTLDRVVGK